MVNLVNPFLFQQCLNILRILYMIFEDWFTLLEANIMSNSIIVLADML